MKAIKSLKNGKSASGDNITNEMLKNGSSVFINALKKLFNYIFDAGKFPSFWNESYKVVPAWGFLYVYICHFKFCSACII